MQQELLSDRHFQKIKEFIPAWSVIKRDDLDIQRLTGITNVTMRASHNVKDVEPKSILVRKFGKSENCCYLDRGREEKILTALSKVQVGPLLYGSNQEIRLQQFIPSKNLESQRSLDDKILVLVGSRLRFFHSIDLDIGDKVPLMLKVCEDPRYLQEARQKWNQPIFTTEDQVILQQIKQWLCQNQLLWLSSKLKELKNNIVFSHNDLLLGNILVKKNLDIMFIDFQYSSYNYEAFDIGNYLVESMYDYEVKEPPYFTVKRDLPQEQCIRRLATVYVLSNTLKSQEQKKVLQDQVNCEAYIRSNPKQKDLIENILRSIPYMMMSSCVFWGIWAIYMSKNPKIPFNYVQFCKSRKDLYFRLKDALP